MARLTKTLLGQPSGRAGDIIFRTRNGKLHFYPAPDRSRITPTLKQKTNTKNFGFCSTFCSAMNEIRVFREKWDKYSTDAVSSYYKMMKMNLCRIKPDYDISGMLLTPPETKFFAELTNIKLVIDGLTVSTAPVLQHIIGGKRVSLQGILQLLTPEDENRYPFSLFPLYTKEIDLIEAMPVSFEINFSNQLSEFVSAYKKRNLIVNLAIKNTQSVPEIFSEEIFAGSL